MSWWRSIITTLNPERLPTNRLRFCSAPRQTMRCCGGWSRPPMWRRSTLSETFYVQFMPQVGTSRHAQKAPIIRGRLSEAEPQSDGGRDVVALEKAEGQTAIHLCEHDPGIEIPFRRKPPIDSGGDPVERPGALRVLAAGARGRPRGGDAEERILDIMIIGADHIEIV